ncbi:hypothetical protein B0H16DRAFT_1266091, partial [Mycena metata]
KEELGAVWGTCVRAWVDLEAASGFDNEGGQLTTDKRPKEIKDFIRGGRRWYIPKHLGDRLGSKTIPNSYVAQWWEWWGVIQPEEGAGWAGLATMHGRTGFMLVLLSLLWWGMADHG